MRSPLNALLTEKALALVSTRRNSELLDAVLADPDQATLLPLKNVCAKVSAELSAEIDAVCGLLGISKRRFLEAAFVEAVQQAHEVIRAEGVEEAISGDLEAERAGGEA